MDRSAPLNLRLDPLRCVVHALLLVLISPALLLVLAVGGICVAGIGTSRLVARTLRWISWPRTAHHAPR